MPWQSVLLKQPGDVPAGAVTDGVRDELAPLVWQTAQPAALLASESVCVWPPIFDRHGFGECGARLPVPWQPAVFRHDMLALPPEKSIP